MSASAAVAAGPNAEQLLWIERVLGVSVQDTDQVRGPKPEDGPPPDFVDAQAHQQSLTGLARWQAARSQAITVLGVLEAAFRDMEDPLSDKGIIQLRAIRANLTERPETPQQLIELVRYIAEDSVVQEAEVPNGFGIAVSLRKPLLEALQSIRSEMTSHQGRTHERAWRRRTAIWGSRDAQ